MSLLAPLTRLLSPRRDLRSRRAAADRLAQRLFYLLAGFPILLALLILGVLLVKSWPVLSASSPWALLTGSAWLPSQGIFGFFPFILATLEVTALAVLLAVPVCLLTAIYLSEYARSRLREAMKPVLDLLAAIPSVVYGVWGVIAIVPLVQAASAWCGRHLAFLPFLVSSSPTGYSVLAGGLVLAVMISPFIIAVTYEILRAVPDGYRQAALAVGSTRWEMVRFAVLPQTASGIMAGIVLGASRALGETMAVLMVVGNVARVPYSIFDPAYPLPALIANNYGEMLSIPLYDSALMLAALILLVLVLLLNALSILALRRIRRGGNAR